MDGSFPSTAPARDFIRQRDTFDPVRLDVTTATVGGRRAVIISLADDDLGCDITIKRDGAEEVTCGLVGVRKYNGTVGRCGYVDWGGAEPRPTSDAAIGFKVEL